MVTHCAGGFVGFRWVEWVGSAGLFFRLEFNAQPHNLSSVLACILSVRRSTLLFNLVGLV